MKNGKTLILIVNHKAEERESFGAMLPEREFDLIYAGDSKEALDYLKEHYDAVDLVITFQDVLLAEGVELIKLIRLSVRLKSVPVVLVISQEETHVIESAMENGAEDVIIMPLEEKTVANRVKNITDARKRHLYHNIMEDVLETKLSEIINSLGVCKCQKCQVDILSLALNRVKPRYVSTEKGKIISTIDRMSFDYLPDIIRALTEAAEMVKKSPKH